MTHTLVISSEVLFKMRKYFFIGAETVYFIPEILLHRAGAPLRPHINTTDINRAPDRACIFYFELLELIFVNEI